MKKLLCVFIFGMVFGQGQLTTRMFDLGNISFSDNEIITFDIYSITGNDLDFAYITFGKLTDVSFSGEHDNMEFFLQVDYIDHDGNTWYDPVSVDAHQGGSVRYKTIKNIFYDGDNEVSLRFLNGSGSANIQLKIIAEFPNEDTGLNGDMNDDDSLDVIDVVMLVDVIVNGGVGNVEDLLNIVTG